MPRYIDADELLLQLDKRKSFEQGRNNAYYKGLRDAKKILEDTPTADVVERKKGRWLNKGGKICCSECGRTNFLSPNFCPECGADMREEKDDEKNIPQN